MRITPLVLHAARRVPALTGRFSDPLNVASISVVAGGTTTLTCSAAHGVATGVSIAVSITDAMTPNPITAAVVDADGNIRLTTQYAHDLTTTPDPTKAKPWNTSATLDGFGSALIDGVKQLVSAPDRRGAARAPALRADRLSHGHVCHGHNSDHAHTYNHREKLHHPGAGCGSQYAGFRVALD